MKRRGALSIGIGIALLILIVAGTCVPLFKRHAQAVACGNQMIAVAFATRLWSEDNNNRLPLDFRSMSNEINTTKILICPADTSRHPVDWSSLSATNCSYEILTPGAPYSETNGAFFRCPIHGYVAYPDGSVFDGTRRLKKGPL